MADGASPYHKRIRLDPEVYAKLGAVSSITIAVRDRQPVFADSAVAAEAVEVLRSHAAKTGVSVYGYCVMPDHIHLVLGPSETCDITTFVGQFKNLAQRAAWQHGMKGAFWQKSFWDHFLRIKEDVDTTAEYVLNNPVRKGMVQCGKNTRFRGR